jgi:hypothetical protein
MNWALVIELVLVLESPPPHPAAIRTIARTPAPDTASRVPIRETYIPGLMLGSLPRRGYIR